MLVRENTEGEYSTHGRTLKEGTQEETVIQECVFTRRGVDRIVRYAFELAARRPRRKLDLGDEIERHHAQHAVLGISAPGSSRGPTLGSAWIIFTSISSPHISSSDRSISTSSSPPNFFGDILSDRRGDGLLGIFGPAR